VWGAADGERLAAAGQYVVQAGLSGVAVQRREEPRAREGVSKDGGGDQVDVQLVVLVRAAAARLTAALPRQRRVRSSPAVARPLRRREASGADCSGE